MADELVQGRRETNEIIPRVSHEIIRVTPNYADIPISDAITSNVTQSVTLTTDNYVYLPDPTTVISGISHALTIVNDV